MIGIRIAHFRITARLGAGGMGEVWRAEDEALGREVALKLLPREFLDDPERRARFEREAKILASLNHPHIASVYEFGETRPVLDETAEAPSEPTPALPREPVPSSPVHYLAMELVPGETLEERIARRSFTPEEALPVALQILEGLEVAHDRGIVHRDLKPANIKLDDAGKVTILDFGLARAVEAEVDLASGVTRSPTLTYQPTVQGAILGTAPYMSPEQARGQTADRRTDVWAFGCLVYEMLSGARAFPGETWPEVLASILSTEPDLSALPPTTPRRWVDLLSRCLAKDPRHRIHHVADIRIELERAGSEDREPSGASPGPPRFRRALLWGIAGAVLGGMLVYLLPRPTDSATAIASPVRFTSVTETVDWGGPLDANVAVHPGGDSWVVRADGEDGAGLWLRRLDHMEPVAIPGTTGGENPFWSPDGRYLGFTTGATILRVEPFVGSPRTVLSLSEGGFFGTPSWGDDGTILYGVLSPDRPAVFRVPAEGGEAEEVLGLEQVPRQSFLGWPRHLPGSEQFLVFAGAGGHDQQLFLASLRGGDPIPVPGVRSPASWVPPGILLFVRDGQALAQPFDLAEVRLTGEPVLVSSSIAHNPRTGAIALGASPKLLVSVNRILHYRLEWFDRQGASLGRLGEPGDMWGPRISPSGDRVAVNLADPPGTNEDLWIFDLDRGIGNRVTATPWGEFEVVWSPDGSHVAFGTDALGPPDVRIRSADGSGEERILVGGPGATFPDDWSPDGAEILYHTFPDVDLWLAPLDGSEPRPWLRAPGTQRHGRFSPDGRSIAFASDELGEFEVFVAPASDADRRQRISTAGGEHPVWSPAGDELLFASRRQVFSVAIDPNTGRPLGQPELLFQLEPPDRIANLERPPDGERLLLAILDEDRLRPTTTVQLGWQSALRGEP